VESNKHGDLVDLVFGGALEDRGGVWIYSERKEAC
jgi:hypothetical protein